MVWVRFTADFDWKPEPSVTVACESGAVLNVPQAAAEAAIAAKRAVRMKKTHRDRPVTEDDG